MIVAAGLSQSQIDQLSCRVQSLLDKECQARGAEFRLKVGESFVLEGEITNFIIVPNRPGVRSYEYADVLTTVETQLRRDDNLNVLLVPARPD